MKKLKDKRRGGKTSSLNYLSLTSKYPSSVVSKDFQLEKNYKIPFSLFLVDYFSFFLVLFCQKKKKALL